MKKFKQSMLGVTLLEIMLVLAIAAMIIVMSVRYYQSASSSQQSTAALSMIQGITAGADQISAGQGYATVSQDSIQSVMNGGQPLIAPWGGTVSITGFTATTYNVSIASTPPAICTALIAQIKSNKKFDTVACASGSFTYTYDASK